MKSRVAIIVVTHNAEKYLPDCLQSIKNQDTDDGEIQFTVFIIDSNSRDQTVEFVKTNYPQFRISEYSENLGYAKGNNIGIQLALDDDYDYLLIVTHDVKPDQHCLSELLKTANKDDVIGMVQPKILLWSDPLRINTIGNESHFLGYGFMSGYRDLACDHLHLKERPITSVSGAILLLKSSLLKEIGQFDESFFMYSEDMDLSWRARLRGYKLFLSPEAISCHFYEFSKNPMKMYYLDRNRIILVLKNYKLLTLILFLPAFALMEIGETLFALQSGWWKEKIRSRYYFLKLNNIIRIYKNRRETQKSRLVSDREILAIYRGDIHFEEIDNVLLKYVGNPILKLYFFFLKLVVFW